MEDETMAFIGFGLVVASLVVAMSIVVGCQPEPLPPQETPLDVDYFTIASYVEDLPITTEEAMTELANEKLGTVFLACTGENMEKWTSWTDYEIVPDEHGMYGNKGTTVINGKSEIVTYIMFSECQVTTEWDDEGNPLSGTFLYRFNFDPNNGWVETLTCNYQAYDNCPVNSETGEYINFRNVGQNPDRLNYMELI